MSKLKPTTFPFLFKGIPLQTVKHFFMKEAFILYYFGIE